MCLSEQTADGGTRCVSVEHPPMAVSRVGGPAARGSTSLQSPHPERAPVVQPTGPLAEAVANLSDRALRKLLGARAYLRGVDYVRRGAVTDISVAAVSASGHVRGSADAPYEVHIALAPDGVSSQCNCPLFSKIEGHCKHVAALLIAVREQSRGGRSRPQHPGSMSNPNQVTAADIGRPVNDRAGLRRR